MMHNKINALKGHSTLHFIKKEQIYQATRLLRTTEMNSSQVGFEVGIENFPYFTKEKAISPGNQREKSFLEQ